MQHKGSTLDRLINFTKSIDERLEELGKIEKTESDEREELVLLRVLCHIRSILIDEVSSDG